MMIYNVQIVKKDTSLMKMEIANKICPLTYLIVQYKMKKINVCNVY